MTFPTPTRENTLGLGVDGLVFGCDYNPEQWDPSVWREDIALMAEAQINLVAINVFGWSQIQPRPGEFTFDALDEVIGLLTDAGIGINLGTGTASPPPWVTTAYPEILPTAADGTRRWPGGRQAWCPSSPVFRRLALDLVEATVKRYGSHPGIRLWHVSNELGCHNAHCYCDVSAAAFRDWLRVRYRTIDALNAAWGTTFWSQRYSAWDEILPPRTTLSLSNSAQAIDFDRFSSDELLSYYRAETALIREHSHLPVTTNFMVTAHIKSQDYWSWAPHMDVIANDHYLDYRLPVPERELSFSADLTRGLAHGLPWLLMENSTSAVNWQPINHAKDPGQMMRNALSHVARGADGVCFFQWRASIQGAEKFHSALVPHSGTGSRVWREAIELGQVMNRLGELSGSRVHSDIAILFSWESWWAVDLEALPSQEVRYLEQLHAVYGAMVELGATVDLVQPGAPLDRYRLVIVPNLYLVSDEAAAVINDYVTAGGHAVVTFFSGIVDVDDRVRPGAYPGAFRQTLGIEAEEFSPLSPGASIALSDGSVARLWSERLTVTTASAVAHYTSGPLAGVPAITRNESGRGVAWYLATALDPADLTRLLTRVAAEARVTAIAASGTGVEIVRRRGDFADWVFILNHTSEPIFHQFTGFDLVSQEPITHVTPLGAGRVHVVRQERTTP